MSSTGANIPSSPQPPRPIPPRYWWLKRIALAVVLLLVVLGILRWSVDVIAARRLSARIEAIRAAGEPILPPDFNTEPIPEEDNAVAVLAEAVEKLVELNPDDPGWQERVTEQLAARSAGKPRPPRRVTVNDILRDPALLDANSETIERLLHDNEEPLRLLHEARFRPAADWGLRFDDSMIDVRPPDLYGHGELARLACVAALVAHRKGDDLVAITHLQDVLACAEHVNAMPSLLGNLMAIVISTTATDALESILPTLQLDEAQEEVDATPTEVRVELENTIQVLMADKEFREGLVSGFQFERAICLDGVRMVTEYGVDDPALDSLGWPQRTLGRIGASLFRPLFRLDGVHVLDDMTAQVSACRAQLFGGEAEPGPDLSRLRFDSVLDRKTACLSAILLPNFFGTTEAAVRDLSRRQLAAAAIAIRLYELDHGRRPDTLDELTPDYLPFIPSDPTVPGDQPILYVPTGPDSHVGLRSSQSGQPVTFSLIGKKATGRENTSSQPASEERVDERNGVERQPGDPVENEDPDDQP